MKTRGITSLTSVQRKEAALILRQSRKELKDDGLFGRAIASRAEYIAKRQRLWDIADAIETAWC